MGNKINVNKNLFTNRYKRKIPANPDTRPQMTSTPEDFELLSIKSDQIQSREGESHVKHFLWGRGGGHPFMPKLQCF